MLPACVALAVLLAAAPEGAGPSSGEVIDRLVATIDRQPLLLSELEFEARVILIQQGGIGAATAPLSEDDLAASLEWCVGQRLALAEADRLQVFDVDEADVAKALTAFQARFPGRAEFEAFLLSQEATGNSLAAVLRRDLRVSRFLDSKVKLSARVTEDELHRYYAAHAQELGGRPYDEVREGIRAQLTRERYRSLARRQLEDLRARADVRILASFARQKPAPTGDAPPARP